MIAGLAPPLTPFNEIDQALRDDGFAIVSAENWIVFEFGTLCKIAIGAATAGTWMIEARFVAAVYAPSDIQKSPIDLSEFDWPVPEDEDAYE